MADDIEMRYRSENCVSTLKEDTDSEWAYILVLCQREYPIGCGVLDSFLSGPDLARRIELVECEAHANAWLRLELRDTLGMNQDWPDEFFERLKKAAMNLHQPKSSLQK